MHRQATRAVTNGRRAQFRLFRMRSRRQTANLLCGALLARRSSACMVCSVSSGRRCIVERAQSATEFHSARSIADDAERDHCAVASGTRDRGERSRSANPIIRSTVRLGDRMIDQPGAAHLMQLARCSGHTTSAKEGCIGSMARHSVLHVLHTPIPTCDRRSGLLCDLILQRTPAPSCPHRSRQMAAHPPPPLPPLLRQSPVDLPRHRPHPRNHHAVVDATPSCHSSLAL
jgi:hypothetical protein